MNRFLNIILLVALASGPVKAMAECNTNPYRKTVTVSGLELAIPQQAVVGELYDAGILFAQLIAAEINRQGKHQAFGLSELRSDSLMMRDRHYKGQVLPDSQFVLSGVVEGMGLVNGRSIPFFKRQMRGFMSLFGREKNQPRQLAIAMALTNRYTQQVVWQKRYVELGNWRHKATSKVGVDNPRFWQVEYGQRASRLLENLVADVQGVMSCLPLMARIDSVQQGVISFSAPPSVQLQPGSELKLLKVNRDSSVEPGVSGLNALVTLVGAQRVEAEFAQSQQGNIQMGDLVMAL